MQASCCFNAEVQFSHNTDITMLIPCLAGWKSEHVGSDDNNSDFLVDIIERFRVLFYQGTIPKLIDYSQSHLNRNIYPGSRYAFKGYPIFLTPSMPLL